MKRDARIGLAVVLMLGLGVTLLVGRALYKHGGSSADGDGDSFASETTTETNGADPASVYGTRDPNTNPTASTQPAVTASTIQATTDTLHFIDDQTGTIPNRVLTGGTGTQQGTPPNHPVEVAGEPDDRTNAQPTRSGHKNDLAATTEFYAYTVGTGDSPWSISAKIFGDGKFNQKIVDSNDLATKKLKVGMILKIPVIPNKPLLVQLHPYGDTAGAKPQHDATPSKPAPAATEAHGPAPAIKAVTYKIETGDSLSTIAKKHYGSNGPKTIQAIIAANHALDPSKLRVGLEITLPVIKP